MALGCNEGLGVPVSKRGMIDQALPDRCPAGCFDHVGLEGGLVNKGKLLQMVAHIRLTARDPETPSQRDVRAHLLSREQRFFYG